MFLISHLSFERMGISDVSAKTLQNIARLWDVSPPRTFPREASQASVGEEAEAEAVEAAVKAACALDPPIPSPDEHQRVALVRGRCVDPSEIRSLLLDATLVGPGPLLCLPPGWCMHGCV